jgi:hypothetical protein
MHQSPQEHENFLVALALEENSAGDSSFSEFVDEAKLLKIWESVSAGETETEVFNRLVVSRVFRWLRHRLLKAAGPDRVSMTLRHRAASKELLRCLAKAIVEARRTDDAKTPEPETGEGAKAVVAVVDSVRENRRALLESYKRECLDNGVRVTYEMIAKSANRRWNDRTPIDRWIRNDSRSTETDDKLIRKIFSTETASAEIVFPACPHGHPRLLPLAGTDASKSPNCDGQAGRLR